MLLFRQTLKGSVSRFWMLLFGYILNWALGC